jgi:hypothetical protein
MMDSTDFLFGVVASIAVGALMGLTWVVSASVIGKECEKMGQFYVDKKVYECKLKGQA